MGIESDTVPGTAFVWQPSVGRFTLTVLAKATIALVPGDARLASEQEPIQFSDAHWDDNPAKSLFAAADLAPLKPRVDVVIVGHAYAPKGQRVRSLVARLAIGTIDKSIEVVADRALAPDGSIRESSPFSKMPIVYERAQGGARTWNPVGVGPDERDIQGNVRLPNLQPVGASPGRTDPVGFGPIAASWSLRTERLAQRAGFTASEWTKHPLPDGFNHAFFNVAPLDQQLERLADDAVLTLEHLHPEHARLVTRLPALGPIAVLESRGAREELALHADTMWIDADGGLATILFKGQRDWDGADANVAVRITVGPRRGGGHVSPAAPATAWPTAQTHFAPGLASPAVQPARRGQLQTMQATPSTLGIEALMPALAAAAKAQPVPLAPPQAAEPAPPPVVPVASGVPPAPPPRMVALPAVVVPSGSAAPIGPPIPSSAAARSAESPWAASARASAVPTHAKSAVLLGVTGASNAAADPNAAAGQAMAARKPRPTAVDLLWFDAEVLPRVRRKKEWKPVLDELKRRAIDPEIDAAGAVDGVDVDDRREIMQLLTRGTPAPEGSIERALDDAVASDGRLAAPLLLLAGEHTCDFDEVEALQAAGAIATPHAGKADDELRVALDQAGAYLGAPGLVLSTEAAVALTMRIRETFSTGKRAVPNAFLDTESERTLLERKAYKMREVYGGPHLRGSFAFAGSTSSVPIYLPVAAAKKLPLFRRLTVRLLVEVGFQVDQFESDPSAVRVRALSRTIRGAT